jgi:hypothetical protein
MVVASTRPHEGARDGVAEVVRDGVAEVVRAGVLAGTEDGVTGAADLTATLLRLEPATCIGNPAPFRTSCYLR